MAELPLLVTVSHIGVPGSEDRHLEDTALAANAAGEDMNSSKSEVYMYYEKMSCTAPGQEFQQPPHGAVPQQGVP